mmetsp:Transcript_9310/g.16797  ORF Transcript_9310/g.16797 Transcript_9310/m.16797 type:complete len:413 (-) Transcript_9310:8-1246(-)
MACLTMSTTEDSAVCVAKLSSSDKLDAADTADRLEEVRVRDAGCPRMTADFLRDCCLREGGYADPELNEVLLLPYKGFRVIENLAAYSALRSLFLECNGITKIENLDGLPNLVSLYLQSNCIKRIEGLDGLLELKYLNLAHNSISVVENLDRVQKLETLNLSQNKLVDVQSLAGLAVRPTLRSVDVSGNHFEDGDSLLDFWPDALPDLDCLYLKNNPCSKSLKDYRKRVIAGLPKLKWLDERPVFALERKGCDAWAAGGKDAETDAKRDHILKEREDKAQSFAVYRQIQEAGAERARLQATEFEGRETGRARLEGASSMPSTDLGWFQMPPQLETGFDPPLRQDDLHVQVQAFLQQKGFIVPDETIRQTGVETSDTSLSLAEDVRVPTAELPSVGPEGLAGRALAQNLSELD